MGLYNLNYVGKTKLRDNKGIFFGTKKEALRFRATVFKNSNSFKITKIK